MRRWRLRGMSVTTRPCLAGAAGAAGAVQVRLVLVGRVGLDHEVDVVDVDAAGRDIRGDEHVDPAARELLQVARAARLVEVAVQRDRTDAVVLEVVGEVLGERAGAGEDEGLAVAVRELGDDVALLVVADDEHPVLDASRRLVLAGDLVHGRVDEELVDERGDALVEGRREEQLLAALGGVPEDALHRLEEPEVAHVVGLVDHRDDDLGEVEATLLDEVLDAAGGADHDVDAALERADLAVLRHAAVDLRGEEADALRDGLHGAVDLQGELAGRGEDERAGLAAHLALAARLARLGPERHEALDRGGAEGDGLARAGLAAAEHVATLEHDRDGRGLDRERRLGAELLQHAHDVGAEAEVGEGHAVDRVGLDGVGLEALEHHVVGRREARAAAPSPGRSSTGGGPTPGSRHVRSRGGAHGHRGRTNGPGGPGGRTNERDARRGRRRGARSSRSNERAGRS